MFRVPEYFERPANGETKSSQEMEQGRTKKKKRKKRKEKRKKERESAALFTFEFTARGNSTLESARVLLSLLRTYRGELPKNCDEMISARDSERESAIAKKTQRE